ncbi:bifunctional glutamate N-acetyltransferase/amino-acid acetyltransferase ArgJ [Paraglaciecola sp. L3A3]|uniref:bifunctional glutamate N-acetyltransferase/amino-acid acetyltransferase ArgJ n=1 Tax=Paraglaciecola sp. L3A3 TaxID=2686358 RepID=UPI00131CB829|nr:bifunctional glutamate N-acetyltransferase/amino-acid acetyltransferase ArgJ [Paraglaciecola sp. L3A3]
MPVNLPSIENQVLPPVAGVRLGWAEAHIKKPDRKDMLVIEVADGSRVSGVFTQNRFCAAPVHICKRHLAESKQIKALLINTGNANAGTGEQGMQDALTSCADLAKQLNVPTNAILPFSTGVILEHLPMDKLLAGISPAVERLTEDAWKPAAYSIMTTDVAPKAYATSCQFAGHSVQITGISKGAGMIHPNMATMLGFLATDAAISQALLNKMTKLIADQSFNCISVDGDTSTNDSFIIIASGKAGNPEITGPEDEGYTVIFQALLESAQYLAKAIVRDGEGATKFITVNVEGALSNDEAKAVGFAIAKSPLVKTAMFASDPNLGRVLAAIGYASRECVSLVNLDVDNIELYFADTLVAEKGGRAKSYTEDAGQKIMQQAEIDITVKLNRGSENTTIWSCDFSYDYVRINAEYRT